MRLQTDRLALAPLAEDDAGFVLELLNEPGFRKFIGDKGVRSLDDALIYLRDGPIAAHAASGFAMCRVAERASGDPVGMCGLMLRPEFDLPDLGFAFLARYWGRGYATEASQAVLDYYRGEAGLDRLLAFADADNAASVRLLEKLGFRRSGKAQMPGESGPVLRFALGGPPA